MRIKMPAVRIAQGTFVFNYLLIFTIFSLAKKKRAPPRDRCF